MNIPARKHCTCVGDVYDGKVSLKSIKNNFVYMHTHRERWKILLKNSFMGEAFVARGICMYVSYVDGWKYLYENVYIELSI